MQRWLAYTRNNRGNFHEAEATRPYFLDEDQFCGCIGSSMLSNSTVYSSESGSDSGKGLPAPMDSFSCVLTWFCRAMTEGFAKRFLDVGPKDGGVGKFIGRNKQICKLSSNGDLAGFGEKSRVSAYWIPGDKVEPEPCSAEKVGGSIIE